jgi:hypothetical protein
MQATAWARRTEMKDGGGRDVVSCGKYGAMFVTSRLASA